MKISNILVATDFSPSAARAVDMAADYARHFQAQLIILHAYRVDIPVASPLTGGASVLPVHPEAMWVGGREAANNPVPASPGHHAEHGDVLARRRRGDRQFRRLSWALGNDPGQVALVAELVERGHVCRALGGGEVVQHPAVRDHRMAVR